MSGTNALDLGTYKGNTCLVRILDKIVMTRLSVIGDQLSAALFFIRAAASRYYTLPCGILSDFLSRVISE